jgi:Peptidase family M48
MASFIATYIKSKKTSHKKESNNAISCKDTKDSDTSKPTKLTKTKKSPTNLMWRNIQNVLSLKKKSMPQFEVISNISSDQPQKIEEDKIFLSPIGKQIKPEDTQAILHFLEHFSNSMITHSIYQELHKKGYVIEKKDAITKKIIQKLVAVHIKKFQAYIHELSNMLKKSGSDVMCEFHHDMLYAAGICGVDDKIKYIQALQKKQQTAGNQKLAAIYAYLLKKPIHVEKIVRVCHSQNIIYSTSMLGGSVNQDIAKLQLQEKDIIDLAASYKSKQQITHTNNVSYTKTLSGNTSIELVKNINTCRILLQLDDFMLESKGLNRADIAFSALSYQAESGLQCDDYALWAQLAQPLLAEEALSNKKISSTAPQHGKTYSHILLEEYLKTTNQKLLDIPLIIDENTGKTSFDQKTILKNRAMITNFLNDNVDKHTFNILDETYEKSDVVAFLNAVNWSSYIDLLEKFVTKHSEDVLDIPKQSADISAQEHTDNLYEKMYYLDMLLFLSRNTNKDIVIHDKAYQRTQLLDTFAQLQIELYDSLHEFPEVRNALKLIPKYKLKLESDASKINDKKIDETSHSDSEAGLNSSLGADKSKQTTNTTQAIMQNLAQNKPYLLASKNYSALDIENVQNISIALRQALDLSEQNKILQDTPVNILLDKIIQSAQKIFPDVDDINISIVEKSKDSQNNEINAVMYSDKELLVTRLFIQTGALTDDEKSMLLSHELGHYIEKHNMYRLLMCTENNADQNAANKIYRTQEYEADLVGLHIGIESGIDPRAIVAMLYKLSVSHGGEQLDDSKSTHPRIFKRISALLPEIEKLMPIWLEKQGKSIEEREPYRSTVNELVLEIK